jgi:hypothetical protein
MPSPELKQLVQDSVNGRQNLRDAAIGCIEAVVESATEDLTQETVLGMGMIFAMTGVIEAVEDLRRAIQDR